MAAIDVSGVQDKRDVTYSSPDIDVLSNTLDSGSLVEVSSYDTFPFSSATALKGRGKIDSPDDIPICTAGQYLHLLSLHDILQLTSDFSRFSHQLGM
jgi:hypothetical protein